MLKKQIRNLFAKADLQIFKSENAIYIPEEIMMRAYLLKATDSISGTVRTIFDVGANIGTYSHFISSIFPSAKVYAFEPISETFNLLKKNTSSKPNIHPVQLAFGSQAEEKKKIFLKQHSQWHSLANNSTWYDNPNNFENITVETIDEFMIENNIDTIDILKTDTEGYDFEVLKGAEKALGQSKIRLIVCEVGFNKHDIQHTYFNSIQEFLFDKGFRVLGFTGLEACYKIENKYGVGYCNCLFLNSDK
jgi:FkbM family methyltransferase